MLRNLFCAAICVASATSAHAGEQGDARFKLGVTAGTLGVGPEISYRLSDNVGVRGNLTFLSISRDIESDDINFDASLKLASGGAMIDVYPFKGGFRVSGGLRINGNKVRGVAQPNSGTSYDIDGTIYTAGQIGTLTAETEINRVAPALTLGYGGGLSKGLVFGIEAGALFQGAVKVRPLTITGTCAGTSPPAACASLAADLEAERQSLNNDISGYKVYPILQLSIGYRF